MKRSATLSAAAALLAVHLGSWSFAAGPDFNNDGFDDLVISAPLEDSGGAVDSGVVHVLHGGSSLLSASGSQLWHQQSDGLNDSRESGDQFGRTLAFGDFNGDGFDDLAIGAPSEDDDPWGTDSGIVHVLYGGPEGLSASAAVTPQIWTPGSPGIANQNGSKLFFGWSLAAGDFNGDARADLVIGAVQKDGEGWGVVHVLYGSEGGLTATDSQLWHPDVEGLDGQYSEIMLFENGEEQEIHDVWGETLAVGDFNADGFDDLTIEAKFNVESAVGGAVNIIYGSASGLTITGNQLFDQNSPGIHDTCEKFDHFGSEMTAGDFNNDGFDDLAVAAPAERSGGFNAAGVIHVLFGSPAGLSSSGAQFWHQDMPGIRGNREALDRFGSSLKAGDFNGDGFDDLAVGATGESISTAEDAGAVHVLFGSATGLTSAANQLLVQNTPELDDQFGTQIANGDYNGDGLADLAIAAPGESFAGKSNAGNVIVFKGRSNGFRASPHQSWNQNSPGISDSAQNSDRLGETLR